MYQFPSSHPSTVKDIFGTDGDVGRGEESTEIGGWKILKFWYILF